MPQVEVPDGFLSDDSSFYGDEDDIRELEHRASIFEPHYYWTISRTSSSVSATAIPQRAAGAAATWPGADVSTEALISNKATFRHPHDGRPNCHQATETVAQFLHRLPPSTTKVDDVGQWIHIAYRDVACNLATEDIANVKLCGGELLDEYEEKLSTLQEEYKGSRSKGAITQKIGTRRRTLERDLLKLARDRNVITGKWMLFPSPDDVDDTWAAVAGATARGKLGIGAKVATDSGQNDTRLIAVYTKDFADKEDIRRVLVKLIDMGLPAKQPPIYYKCDAYTHLDIMSRNVWGLKPSMHSSTEILARKW